MEDAQLALALKDELERRLREERLRVWCQPHLGQKRHHKQIEAVFSHRRRLAVIGGNRTGKTVVSSVRLVLFLLGRSGEPYVQDWGEEDRAQWHALYGDMPPLQAWSCTVNWDYQRDIKQPEMLRWLPRGEIADMVYRMRGVLDYIRLKNGSAVTFKSYESGAKAFGGKALDYCDFDEEPEHEIWEEARMRLLDRRGWCTLAFTPVNGISWSYSELYLNESGDPETECVHFTWDDNPYLTESEKARLLAEMSEDERAARVYGEYVTPGGTVFSRGALLARKREAPPPVAEYSFDAASGKFVPMRGGELLVWSEPEPGGYYCIGADVSEGLPSGDNSAACVVEADTAIQAAELCGKFDPDTFARMLDALGRWYNNAELVVERNNTGQAVVLQLDATHLYPALYRHEEDQRYGWPETVRTRPVAVALMQALVRDHPECLMSRSLIDECLTFVRNAQGRPAAMGKGKKGGAKDDRVFAMALALAGRELVGPPLDAVLPRRRRRSVVSQVPSGQWRHPSLDEDEDTQQQAYADWNQAVWVDFDG